MKLVLWMVSEVMVSVKHEAGACAFSFNEFFHLRSTADCKEIFRICKRTVLREVGDSFFRELFHLNFLDLLL